MLAPPKDDVSYEPNHFSLLVPRSDVPPACISVSDDERTNSLDKNTTQWKKSYDALVGVLTARGASLSTDLIVHYQTNVCEQTD